MNALSQTESIDALRLHPITRIWTIKKDLVGEQAESDSTLEFKIEIKSLVWLFPEHIFTIKASLSAPLNSVIRFNYSKENKGKISQMQKRDAPDC